MGLIRTVDTKITASVLCVAVVLGACLVAPAAARPATDPVNSELTAHDKVLDAEGKLLAWYEPERNLGYDKVLHLGWDFVEHKVPRDKHGHTGLKIYLVASVYDPRTLQGWHWQHNPAMVYATFVDSVTAWYPYSGDREAVRTVRGMLDYMLAHGTTPAGWDWPNVPFTTACAYDEEYGRCNANLVEPWTPRTSAPAKHSRGVIDPDKVGELGFGYVEFYELTGDRKYLEAAIQSADALARHERPGDADHTPWPFRVDARTGAVSDGEEYGGVVASPLRLFDELIRLGKGDVAAYEHARDTAWRWLVGQQLNPQSPAYDRWSGYFEDVKKNTDNLNQQVPTYTAYYLLTRPDPEAVDPEWRAHVAHLIAWVHGRFGRGPFYGAWGIDEQGTPTPSDFDCCSPAGLGSDSSRWAAVNALYAERTGDAQAREDAYRSLNYATYFADSDGKVTCCGPVFFDQYWFSDGYSDYLRHFNWVMGALPELAPIGADHLLRSSSPVQQIDYSPRRVRYRTFDKESTEVLRLSFEPTQVRAGDVELRERRTLDRYGFTVTSVGHGDFVVRVRHSNARRVVVEGRS